jgi:uncharacterized tellurite resistance protein B-like protein
MAILLAILGAVGGAIFWLWRIQQAAHIARDVADAAEGLANLPRKMRFKHKAGKQGVDHIDDPREAAAALIYGAAKCAGEVSTEQRAAIEADIVALFEIEDEFASELLARAAWHVSALIDPLNAVNKLTDKLAQRVDRKDLADLAVLIENAVQRSGSPLPDQVHYISKFKRRAGLV